jgi:hypothetical protein
MIAMARWIAYLGLALALWLTGCGGDREQAAAVKRLQGAGFQLTCSVTGNVLRNGRASPAVPVKILDRQGLVVVVATAGSEQAATTAGALRVHPRSVCASYGPTIAHRTSGREIVFAAPERGASYSAAEVTASIVCAQAGPCRIPPAPAAPKPTRHEPRHHRPPTPFAQVVDRLPLGGPPLRPLQVVVSAGDAHDVVVTVDRGRFCGLGVPARAAAVAGYARTVGRRFAARGVRAVTMTVSLPSDYGRVRALARGVLPRVPLTPRGARPRC